MSDEERTPRSGRTKKKKSTFASKLAAKSGRSRSSNEGSAASLQRDSDDSDDRRHGKHYPIDARVEVERKSGLGGALEDDSDEGIEMASGSYEPRRNQSHRTADSPLDKMRYLNMRNEEPSEHLHPSSMLKGEKRFREQNSSSGDEHKSKAKTKKYPEVRKVKGRVSGSENSEDEDDSDKHNELRREYRKLDKKSDSDSDDNSSSHRNRRDNSPGGQSKTRHQKNSLKNNAKHSKEYDSDSDIRSSRTKNGLAAEGMDANHSRNRFGKSPRAARSEENLLGRYEDMLTANDSLRSRNDHLDPQERAEMNDGVPDLYNHRRIPEPGLSHSPMMSNHTGVGRGGTGPLVPSYDRPWSATNPAAMTFDAMSQRSYQSTSVLPLISTREVKARSFLVGSINSRCSLLGVEELERYFPERKMRLFVGTWNMMEMKEVPKSLDEFLLPETCDYVQDVYVISTQESCPNRREWEIKIQETLGPQHVLFHSGVHGVLYLSVFIRRDLIWFCSVVEEDCVSTRAGPSSVKTKGAVAVSFTFFGTTFLFVNSHFTPHDGKVKERVADYQKIIKTLRLPQQNASKQYTQANDDVTSRFDCAFWSGDLNFRIERQRDHVDLAVQGITSQEYPDYDDLIMHDELSRARNEGLIFQNFQEGRITFQPTYKFDPGTDNYDSSKKMRIPSYTDRILFRTRKKSNTVCLHYDAITGLRLSDHRPVYAMFEVNLRPGRDNVPLAAGTFNREVWLEVYSETCLERPHVRAVALDRWSLFTGNRRRAESLETRIHNQKTSTICSVQ